LRVRELAVSDAFEFTPDQHKDERGLFLEWFVGDRFRKETGHTFDLAQANCSVSLEGVVRGIHFADVPPGQAKFVTCVSGAVLDVVVDLRVGSPRFGARDEVRLDDDDRRSLYVAEGLGHAFMALSDRATVMYLCSEQYDPTREHTVHALDPEIGISWPGHLSPLLSPRDAEAPSLRDARSGGILPTFDACRRLYG